MSKKNPLAKFFSFMQKKRGFKDIQVAIDLLEEALAKLKAKVSDEKSEMKEDMDNDDIRALEEKLKENNEIAQKIREQIESLDKQIDDKENELKKLYENMDAYNKERLDKEKLLNGEYERYLKDRKIRNKQEDIIDDIKEIYNDNILPYKEKFPKEVENIGEATNLLRD